MAMVKHTIFQATGQLPPNSVFIKSLLSTLDFEQMLIFSKKLCLPFTEHP